MPDSGFTQIKAGYLSSTRAKAVTSDSPLHTKNHKKKNTLSTFHVLGQKERITSEYLPVAQECDFDIIEIEKEVVPGKKKCKQPAKSGKTIESKANETELVTTIVCLSMPPARSTEESGLSPTPPLHFLSFNLLVGNSGLC